MRVLLFLACFLSTFFASFAEAFSLDSIAKSAKISPGQLSEIAADVQAEAAGRVHSIRGNAACGTCAKGINFAACPTGYDLARSGECSPSSYQGICNKPTRFLALSDVEKAEAEKLCGFCFPCA